MSSVTSKDWATLQAQAALAGHQLYRTPADDGTVQYFCCRWGMVKALGSLDEVCQFLEFVTGKPAALKAAQGV